MSRLLKIDAIDAAPKLFAGRVAVHAQALRELRALTGLPLRGLADQLRAEGVRNSREVLVVALSRAERGESNLDAVLLEQTCEVLRAALPSQDEALNTYRLAKLFDQQLALHLDIHNKRQFAQRDAAKFAARLRAMKVLAEDIQAEGSPLVEQAELLVEQIEALVLAAADADAKRLESELAPKLELAERLDADVREARTTLINSDEPAATCLRKLIARVSKT